MQRGRIRRHGVRQERAVAATNGDVISGKRDDGRMFPELDGVAVDDRLRQQAPVDVHDARVEEDRKLCLLMNQEQGMDLNDGKNFTKKLVPIPTVVRF